MAFPFSSLLPTRRVMDGRRGLYTVVTVLTPHASTHPIGTRRILYVYHRR